MKTVMPLLLVVAFWGGHRPEAAAQEVQIREWPVPWEDTRPRDPYVGPDGRVWFVGQRADYVAYLEPASGEFTRYELEEGAGPHNLIVDAEGYVWYAGNRANHIGRLDPADGSIEKFPMPDPAARDPHTLVFDHDGNIWFTVQNGGFVGKLDVGTGEVRLVPMSQPGYRPYGIVIDAANRPWIAAFGTNKIVTVDPQTMALREYDLPQEDSRPRRLQVTADGMVWYVDYSLGYLGRLDPATGTVEQWASPGGARARAYGMAVDDRDRLWFVESGPDPNRFVGFEPATQAFFSVTAIGSGGGTVRHMYFHPATRTVWFGTDANTIGRAQLP